MVGGALPQDRSLFREVGRARGEGVRLDTLRHILPFSTSAAICTNSTVGRTPYKSVTRSSI